MNDTRQEIKMKCENNLNNCTGKATKRCCNLHLCTRCFAGLIQESIHRTDGS